MKKLLLIFTCFLGLIIPVFSQTTETTPHGFVMFTVSSLPTASSWTNKVVLVTDGITPGDCTSGGGSMRVICSSNGTTWNSSGGSNSLFTGSTAIGTACGGSNTGITGTAAAPIISLSDQSVKSPHLICMPTLSANVTSVTINNTTNGADIYIDWPQVTSGSPYTVGGYVNISSTKVACQVTQSVNNPSYHTVQHFIVEADGMTLDGEGCSSTDPSDGANTFSLIDSGTANAVVLTGNFPTSYTTGQSVWFTANATSTGATTININSLGNKNVTKAGSTALASGNKVSGTLYFAIYDGTEFQLINFTPLAADLPLIPANKLAAGTFDVQTDGATITWAVNSVLNASASVTIAGNRTLNLTGLVVMGNYVLKVTQGSGGSHSLTPGTGCTWLVLGGTGSGTFALSTMATDLDVIAFTYDGTNCLATVGKAYAAP